MSIFGHARSVVSGSYYAEGDSVHIQTRISDARDGRMMGTVGPVVGSIGASIGIVLMRKWTEVLAGPM